MTTEAIKAAKDQAAKELGYRDFDNVKTQWDWFSKIELIGIYDLAMEIYHAGRMVEIERLNKAVKFEAKKVKRIKTK